MLLKGHGKGWQTEMYRIGGPIRLDTQTPDLYLAQLGRFTSLGRFQYQQIATAIDIHIISDGAGVMEMDGRAYPVHAGDVFTFFPDHHYTYFDKPKMPWRYVWLTLEGVRAREALRHVGVSPSHPKLHRPLGAAAQVLFDEISAVYAQPAVPPTFAIASGWRVVDLLAAPSTQPPKPQGLAEAAKYLIERSTMAVISIDELSRELNVSRSALFRAFRSEFGMSPKAYLDDLRMRRAKRLLRQSDASIKQIALHCGYASTQYFIRAFRSRCGASPGKWRAQQNHPQSSDAK